MNEEARIALALTKALTRPEILEYLREQIIQNTISYMNNLTDEEVEQYLENRSHHAKTKKS